MNTITTIKNVLQFIGDNWGTILAIIAIAFGVIKKTNDFLHKSKAEQVAIIKNQISNVMLKKVFSAENLYSDAEKAGAVKRAQVIEEIYRDYPILSKVVDQESLLNYIDEAIDKALDQMKDTMIQTKEETDKVLGNPTDADQPVDDDTTASDDEPDVDVAHADGKEIAEG